MALMHDTQQQVRWFDSCRLCGSNYCADLDWLARTYGSTAELPPECPRCDPLSFLEMPFVVQPWHP